MTIDSMIRFHIIRFSHRLYLCSLKLFNLASSLEFAAPKNTQVLDLFLQETENVTVSRPVHPFCAVPSI